MNRLLRFFSTFETTLSYFLVVALTVLLTVQIVNRYVFQTSFVWLEEIIRISFVWLIYFTVASAAREDRHIRVGIIDLFVPASTVRVVDQIADALVFVFSLLVVWLGVQLVQSSVRFGDVSPVTNIPMGVIYAVIPFCFALIAIRVLQFNIRSFRAGGAPRPRSAASE